MAKIRLDLSQFKASGIYTVEFDASENVIINTQTTRLVVGFSKKGPINAPVFCPDVKTARRIYGDIDKDMEKKGSFFHRSLFTCLETGPCFALNLVPLNNGDTTKPIDKSIYKSFSMSIAEANGVTAAPLYSSYFNKERFYFPDTDYFLANVESNSLNEGKLFNFVNLGQTPFSIFIRKTGNLAGFDVTARDWYGQNNVPPFVKEFDYISDYFVKVEIVAGNWTDFEQLSIDPKYSTYFDATGLKKTQVNAFLNDSTITRIGSFEGCLIPDLVDNNGVNWSIDTMINAGLATTGLFCVLDREALNDYDSTDITSAGRVDMIGHSLINSTVQNIDFLSYKFMASEHKGYTAQGPLNSTSYLYDLGTGATGNLPAGTGSTGAAYDAMANGWSENSNDQAAYFTSFYSTGNSGKFNNVLNLREEAFSTTQYAILSALTPGSALSYDGSNYVTITAVSEVAVGSDTRLKLTLAHPDKLLEGSTSNKNAAVLAVGATYMVIGGTGAYSDLNIGDWVLTQNTGLRYYFRVTATGSTTISGTTASQIYVDTTTTEFEDFGDLTDINTLYRAYWESTSGGAGSLLDVIDTTSAAGRFTVIPAPDIQSYTSSQYTAWEFSPLYEDFDDGIITNGDNVYVDSGNVKLYISGSIGYSTADHVKQLTLSAYRDASLTIGYTGAWNVTDIWDSDGATTVGNLRVYSLTGDYSSTIGVTGMNSTRTECYITPADESKIEVGQYIVADPINSGTVEDYILTRVLTKSTVLSGTYKGYYKITTYQRMADYAGSIVRYKTLDQAAPGFQPTYLPGFTMTSFHKPDGSDTQLAKILGMLNPANAGLYEALSSRHVIAFRYIIDSFNGGLQPQSAPKNLISKLAKNRQKCMAILNAPSIQKFIDSTDPRFTSIPTTADPKPVLQSSYIAEGGNLSLSPSFTYSLPDEENGAKFCGFFSPFLIIRENNKNFSIPPAADVSNNFIRKFINGQPYSIVAGPRRGVISNPLAVGLEYDFSDSDRDYLEPFGWNPIVYRRGVGYMIYGNQAAYQKTPSAFNNLHVRDLLITIEEAVEDILGNFIFEFNDSATRLQIKSIVDAYLDNVRSGGGIYEFQTIMDSSNNTPDIIDQNFAIIDIGIEPARGAQKFINRVTVLKTGGIASGGFTVA